MKEKTYSSTGTNKEAICSDKDTIFKERESFIKSKASYFSKKFPRYDKDDIIQEMWLNVLACDKKLGKTVEMGLVHKICMDVLRKYVRVSTYKINKATFSMETPIQTVDGEELKISSCLEDPIAEDSLMKIEIHDFIDTCSEKEKKFFNFYLGKAGLPVQVADDYSLGKHGFTGNALAVYLGVGRTDSYEYRKIKKSACSKLLEYCT